MSLVGIFGRPYIDLEPFLDLTPLEAIHEEICLGLAQVPVDFTGGSHRSMGIMPPSRVGEAHRDYGEVIRGMSRTEFTRFIALADDPSSFDPEQRASYRFGEEQDHLLSKKQMRYLNYRYGVYFPWKVYYEMIPNLYWTRKARRRASPSPEKPGCFSRERWPSCNPSRSGKSVGATSWGWRPTITGRCTATATLR